MRGSAALGAVALVGACLLILVLLVILFQDLIVAPARMRVQSQSTIPHKLSYCSTRSVCHHLPCKVCQQCLITFCKEG